MDARWLEEWTRAWQCLAGDAQSNPWVAALDQLARSGRDHQDGPVGAALDNLTAQSRAFFELGQQLADHCGSDWPQSVCDYLDALAGRLRDPETAAALAGLPALDAWRRFAGQSVGQSCGQSFDHGGGEAGNTSSLLVELDRLLQTPAVGFTREHQQAVQELSRRWLAFEQAQGEYLACCAETARLAAERLRERLNGQLEAGGGPASVRELYDVWVACCEEVHGERAMSDEHIKRQGRMINAWMAYRQQAARLMDRLAEAADLPTRRETDALHRKVRALQRELRALQTGQGPAPDS